jgi:hypothetical protein
MTSLLTIFQRAMEAAFPKVRVVQLHHIDNVVFASLMLNVSNVSSSDLGDEASCE